MKQDTTNTATSCVVMLIVLAISMTIGGFCWQYTINTWLEFAGKDPAIQWWHGALISIVPHIGGFSIGAAVLTWILMLFLG